MDWKPPTSVH
jgi:hypothetical protein